MLSTFPVLLFLKMTPCRLSRSRPSFCGRAGHEGTRSPGTAGEPRPLWVQPPRHKHHRPATDQPQLHRPRPPHHTAFAPPVHPPTHSNPGSAPGPPPRPLAHHGPLHLLVDLVELQRVGHGGCGLREGTGTSSGEVQQPPQPGMPGAAAEESVTAAAGGQRVSRAGDGLLALPSAPGTRPRPPGLSSQAPPGPPPNPRPAPPPRTCSHLRPVPPSQPGLP